MMPLRRNYIITGLYSSSDLFMNTVTEPKRLQLLVTFLAKPQRIPAPQPLIRLAVIIQIRRRRKTTPLRASQEQNLAFPHPQENADPSAALVSVIVARAHLRLVQFGLTAVALRTEDLPAHQTHRGISRVVVIAVRARERRKHVVH